MTRNAFAVTMLALIALELMVLVYIAGLAWSSTPPVDKCPADPDLLVCAEVWDLWTPR